MNPICDIWCNFGLKTYKTEYNFHFHFFLGEHKLQLTADLTTIMLRIICSQCRQSIPAYMMAGHVEEHKMSDQQESGFLASLPTLTSLDESLEQEENVEEREKLVKNNKEEVEDTNLEAVEELVKNNKDGFSFFKLQFWSSRSGDIT